MDLSGDFADRDHNAVERQWVEAIRNGEKEAFKKMFETWYNPLLRFAFRYVRSEAVAEELVQDVFLWIWENREKWNVEGKLKTYLFRAVKYKAMDYWRHQRTREQYMEELSGLRASSVDSDLQPETEEDDFIQAAQQAIEELPERPRMIYKLHRLEGLTYMEIADVLDISPKTVESHMGRALDFLRKRLSRYLPLLIVFEFVREILK